MSLNQPDAQRNRPYQQYETAIDGLAALTTTIAKVSQESVRGDWRTLTIDFGGYGNGESLTGMNLEIKIRLGLIETQNKVQCHVDIRIEDQYFSLEIESEDPGNMILQPVMPAQYEQYLEAHVPQHIRNGFKFAYQYAEEGSDNPISSYWVHIVDEIIATIKSRVADVYFNGNRLNSLALENLRIALSASLNTVMINYFMQGNQDSFRHAYIQGALAEDPRAIETSSLHSSFELAYIASYSRFLGMLRGFNISEAHSWLMQGNLVGQTELSRMYKTYLAKVGYNHPDAQGRVPLPPVDQTMVHNYNPALILAATNYLWKVLSNSNLDKSVTIEQLHGYVRERILNMLELMGTAENVLLTRPSMPLALDMTNPQTRNIIDEALTSYLRIYRTEV